MLLRLARFFSSMLSQFLKKLVALQLEAAKKFHEQDAAKVEAARNGTSNRAWVRKKLEEKKTEFIDGMYGE